MITVWAWENMGLLDNISGRRLYRQGMDKSVMEIACSDEPWAVDERWEKIRYGWYFGNDELRDEMIAAMDGVMERKRRDSFYLGGILLHNTVNRLIN